MIWRRGNPDSYTKGEKTDVHLCCPASPDGVHQEYPLCFNGAYNIIFTDTVSQVTCQRCKDDIDKGKPRKK